MEEKNIKEMGPAERARYEIELIRCSFDTNQEEQWIELPVTEGFISGQYFISSYARVMRITAKRGRKILTPTYCNSGFWITLRNKQNHPYGFRIDRLMACFHKHPYHSIRKVQHLNNNRFCNSLKNLEFVLWE